MQPADELVWKVQEGFIHVSGTLLSMAGRPPTAASATRITHTQLLQQDSPSSRASHVAAARGSYTGFPDRKWTLLVS